MYTKGGQGAVRQAFSFVTFVLRNAALLSVGLSETATGLLHCSSSEHPADP
jgi:hypothetical protein